SVFDNGNLRLTAGDSRSLPFTPGGNHFSSRALIGAVSYRLADAALPANPGPSSNGGAIDSGVFFDLQSTTGVVVTALTTANQATPTEDYEIDVYTRSGTALGNVSGGGPATSSAGWTFLGTAAVKHGAGDV